MGAKLSQFDLDHFEDLFKPDAFHHYSAHVVRLIRKADWENKKLLAVVYPDHVMINTIFDNAPAQSRLWRCESCSAINARLADEVHPGSCVTCGKPTEPPLPPRKEA